MALLGTGFENPGQPVLGLEGGGGHQLGFWQQIPPRSCTFFHIQSSKRQCRYFKIALSIDLQALGQIMKKDTKKSQREG